MQTYIKSFVFTRIFRGLSTFFADISRPNHNFIIFAKTRQIMKYTMILAAAFLTFGIATACANNTKSAKTENAGQVEKTATVIELTSDEFNRKVYDLKEGSFTYLGDKPAIVDFNATWCGPCRRIAPILEELAAEYAGQIVIYKVDVDKCGDVAGAFNIQSIPAVLYIPMEGEPQMTVGSRGKDQFKNEIESLLLKK